MAPAETGCWRQRSRRLRLRQGQTLVPPDFGSVVLLPLGRAPDEGRLSSLQHLRDQSKVYNASWKAIIGISCARYDALRYLSTQFPYKVPVVDSNRVLITLHL